MKSTGPVATAAAQSRLGSCEAVLLDISTALGSCIVVALLQKNVTCVPTLCPLTPSAAEANDKEDLEIEDLGEMKMVAGKQRNLHDMHVGIYSWPVL